MNKPVEDRHVLKEPFENEVSKEQAMTLTTCSCSSTERIGDIAKGHDSTVYEKGTYKHSVACLPKFWPCAPDGFLPNSVVRNIIKPIAPRDYSALIKELDAKLTSAKLAQVTFDISRFPKLIKSEEEVQIASVSPDDSSEETSMNEYRRRLLLSDDDSDDDFTELENEDELEAAQCLLSKSPEVSNESLLAISEKKNDFKEGKSVKAEKSTKKPTMKKKNSVRVKTDKEKFKEKKKEPKASGRQSKKHDSIVTKQPKPEVIPEGTSLSTPKKKVLNDIGMVETSKAGFGVIDNTVHEVLQKRMDKDWFPKNIELNVTNVVRESIKRLSGKDAITAREICALLVDIKKHLEIPTPILHEVIHALRDVMKCKSPAVKFAAVKTAVELAEMDGGQCDTVLADLISMLNDPAKVVREEAKKGLLSLAGINDFNTLQSVATRVSALKSGPTLKKDDENLDDLRKWTDTYSKKAEASGISNRSVTDWLIGSQPKPLKEDLLEDGSCEETVDEECAVSQEKANEIKSIEKKTIESPNYIELIAPRLAKKFQQLTVDSNSDCSSLEKISKEECDMKEILLRLDDFSTNSSVSFEEEDSPSPTKCTESNVTNETQNNTGPAGIRKVKIVKKVKEVRKGKKLPHHKKQELVSALLEACAYMLLTKRAFKDQNREPDDEIVLKKLALILKNLVIREDSKIVPVADKVLQFLKNFKDKIQSDVLKLTLEGVLPSRKRLECNDTQDDPTDTIISRPLLHHRHLIPSPISRALVPGIRGERIANAVEFSNSFPSTQALPREHQILGIPERLGNVAIADSGFCQFGKMKLSWTSRAPCYDMDLKALNEQRIKPLLIPQRTLPDETEIYDKRVTSNSILPLLFKQRMNTSTQEIKKTIARNSQSRKKMGRNVIRLPRISFEKEKGQRPESVASVCSDIMDFNSSKEASNPPPPPNTAELRL